MGNLKAIMAKRLLKIVNSNPELVGCQIYYRSKETGEISISPGIPASKNAKKIVIFEENNNRTNRSFLMKELTSLFTNCGLTLYSASGVVGGAVAAAPTGGLSIVVSIVSWSGVVVSGLKCSNSIGRSLNSIFDGDGNSLNELDNDEDVKKIIEYFEKTEGGIELIQSLISLGKLGSKFTAVGSIADFFSQSRSLQKRVFKELLTKMGTSPQGKKQIGRAHV